VQWQPALPHEREARELTMGPWVLDHSVVVQQEQVATVQEVRVG